jgi:hypothetical protein
LVDEARRVQVRLTHDRLHDGQTLCQPVRGLLTGVDTVTEVIIIAVRVNGARADVRARHAHPSAAQVSFGARDIIVTLRTVIIHLDAAARLVTTSDRTGVAVITEHVVAHRQAEPRLKVAAVDRAIDAVTAQDRLPRADAA